MFSASRIRSAAARQEMRDYFVLFIYPEQESTC
jgi:hypothetical protein